MKANRIRNTLFTLVLICILVLLTGCQVAPAPQPTAAPKNPEPTATPQPTATPEEPQVLTIGLGRKMYYGPKKWYFLHNSLAVWEPLITLDNDMVAQPVLATSWEMNEDGTVWTFHLREGVKFHDGTPFDADAVLLNIPQLQEEYTKNLTHLESLEKVDDHTVRFNFTQPTPNLNYLIANTSSAMMSPTALGEDGRPTTAVGTGPFKFVEYIEDDAIILERNDDYWGGPAKVDQVIYKYIPDANTRLSALQTGEIDAIADVGCLQPEQASIIEKDPNLILLQQGVATTHYLAFNGTKPPFDDVRLRQAVSKSLDRQVVVDNTLFGYGDPGISVITPHARQWVNTSIAPHYDMAGAKALADEVLGGKRVEARLVLHSGWLGRWPYENISQILQATVAELGIDVTIDVVEGGAWNEAVSSGDYNITMHPFTLMSGDPHFFLSPWLTSDGVYNKKRSHGYSNERVDELVEMAISEVNEEMRKAYYNEVQAIVAQAVPLTPLYHEVTIYATRKNVRDLTLNVTFKPSLEKVYFVAE